MTITREAFYGKSLFSTINADFVLPVGVRAHMVTPTGDGIAVRVPESKFTRDGGPIYYVFNMSPTYGLSIKSNDGLTTFDFLEINEAAIVMHTTSGVWRVITKSYAGGPLTNLDPQPYTVSITSNQTCFNLRTHLEDHHNYDGTSAVNVSVTIASGVKINSYYTHTAAFDTGEFPTNSSVSITNNGTIIGAGGKGGDVTVGVDTHVGGDGGHAINLRLATSINNSSGQIIGGGGGGGGFKAVSTSQADDYGGGGGGAGDVPGAGGGNIYKANNVNDGNGGSGELFGFPALNISTWISGFGGFPGCPGEPMLGWDRPLSDTIYGEGGAPGFAVNNAEYLTWTSRGYLQGPVVDLTNSAIDIYISSYSAAINLKDYCEYCGWNGTSAIDVSLTIETTGIVYNQRVNEYWMLPQWSQMTANKATIRTGIFPTSSTVTITNKGSVYGSPGWGGGGYGNYQNKPGGDGGDVIWAEYATTIDNQGALYAGGGGGGGGGKDSDTGIRECYGGTGGAGVGHPRVYPLYPWADGAKVGAGGYVATICDETGDHDIHLEYQPYYYNKFTLEDKNILPDTTDQRSYVAVGGNTPGEGASGYFTYTSTGNYYFADYNGGDGGDWGEPGAAGADGTEEDGAHGGAAGRCTYGEQHITWTTTGTRHGSLISS